MHVVYAETNFRTIEEAMDLCLLDDPRNPKIGVSFSDANFFSVTHREIHDDLKRGAFTYAEMGINAGQFHWVGIQLTLVKAHLWHMHARVYERKLREASVLSVHEKTATFGEILFHLNRAGELIQEFCEPAHAFPQALALSSEIELMRKQIHRQRADWLALVLRPAWRAWSVQDASLFLESAREAGVSPWQFCLPRRRLLWWYLKIQVFGWR